MNGTRVNKRSVSLVAAILLAALATAALFTYIRAVERDALAQADPVPVYIATQTIPAGTSGEEAVHAGLIEEELLPRRAIVEGAITEPTEIEGLFAQSEILPGEQIRRERFAAEQRRELLLPVPENRQAMTVEVGVPPGVAGFVRAEDRVSVIATITPDGQPTRSQYLVQNVEVLAVGRNREGGSTQVLEGGDRILLTLALTSEEAEKVALGQSAGELYFTLVPSDQGDQPSTGRTVDDLFS